MTLANHVFPFDLHTMTDKYRFIPFLKDKELYSNFNFSVFLDDYCNADCKFCVANIRCKTKNRKNVFGKNYNAYLKSLDKMFAFLRPLNPTISLTGGEPTLFPLFDEVVSLVNQYNFRIRAVTTNASQLLKNNQRILNCLIKNNWTYLNLSLPHWEQKRIEEIMRYKDTYPSSFADLLSQAHQAIKGTCVKPRLSCALLKEGIGDLSACEKYVNFYNKLGYDNFIFRQLTYFNGKDTNQDIVRYNEQNVVTCEKIWKENEEQDKFTFFKRNIGYYYYVELYKYANNTIAFESADLAKRKQEMQKYNYKKVFEVVYHPNGNLCSGWDGTQEILLNYQDL